MIVLLRFLQFIFRIIFLAPPRIALFCMRLAGWKTQIIAKMTPFRKSITENIKMVFPQANAKQIADKLIENTAYAIFELLCLPFFRKEHFEKVISWQGEAYLDKALEEKKGAIILTMHAGNYELIAPALANRGYKINAVLRAPEDPLFELVNYCRSSGGVKLINVLQEDMYKETLKALSNNELVILLADTGALESRHEFVNFLGHRVPAATGWLTLAQRGEAAVIPVLAKKEPNNCWEGAKNTIIMFQPFKVTKDNRESAMEEAGKTFEAFIEHYPEQWIMFLNTHETRRMMNAK